MMGGWIRRWMDGWTDSWTDGGIHLRFNENNSTPLVPLKTIIRIQVRGILL